MAHRRLITIAALLTAITTAVVVLFGDLRSPAFSARSTVQLSASFTLPLSDALPAAITEDSNDDYPVECGGERALTRAAAVPRPPVNTGASRTRSRTQSTVLRI